MFDKAKIAILALILLAPGAALAGEQSDYGIAQARYLRTAESYRLQAEELSNRTGALRAPQQAIVGELVQVYEQLADTKVALAGAIGARDWPREEALEQSYYRLKDREQQLWAELDRTK